MMRNVLSSWILLPSHIFVCLIPSIISLIVWCYEVELPDWIRQAGFGCTHRYGLIQIQEQERWWRLTKGFNTAAFERAQDSKKLSWRSSLRQQNLSEKFCCLFLQRQNRVPNLLICHSYSTALVQNRQHVGSASSLLWDWHLTELKPCSLAVNLQI